MVNRVLQKLYFLKEIEFCKSQKMYYQSKNEHYPLKKNLPTFACNLHAFG